MKRIDTIYGSGSFPGAADGFAASFSFEKLPGQL